MLTKTHGAFVAAFTALFALAIVGPANAVAYDLAPVVSGITDQITASLPLILPVAGGLIALFVAWRLIKRMTAA